MTELRINIDPSRFNKSEDPAWWYVQATCYHEAFKILLGLATTIPGPPVSGPAVFLLATGTEVYMKAYLLSRGYSLDRIKKFSHRLPELRAECRKFDPRFDDESVKYVSDQLGPLMTRDGGIRYPVDFGGVSIVLPYMPNALDVLNRITEPIFTE